MKKTKTSILSWLFLLLLVLELGWHTFFTNAFGVYVSPIVIFLTGFLLVAVAYKIHTKEKVVLQLKNTTKTKWIIAGVFVLFAVIFIVIYGQSIKKFEINSLYSDVIPTLMNYNKKLLQGEFPYAPIQYDGWTVYPNYLTFQWIPYLIPELLRIDYRLFALFIFYVAVLVAYMCSYSVQWSVAEIAIKLIYPFFFLWMFKDHHPDVFGYTTELTIVAFYILFAVSLFSKRWIWIVLATSLCLYSRFSFLFLLPFFGIFVLYQKGWKTSLKIVIGIIVVGLLVYVLPFMTIDPYVFTRGLSYYAEAAVGEWVSNAENYPSHIGRGFGFAVYFYDFFKGTLEEKVAMCRHWHIGLSIAVSLILCLVFVWKHKTMKQDSFYALLALKIYFLVFYSFIHVPYLYLQLVPLGISLVIFYKLNLFSSTKLKSQSL
ncbi:MAG: hypothetical protein KDE33_12165 [Bacteroidetes bacterium]|nr:hypothetical protein [Bacteroidota bacterium]